MLNDVIIYCVGEFGRTPRIQTATRDEITGPTASACYSLAAALGRTHRHGASEKWGGGVQERLVTPLDLLATIYHTLGVPLDTHYEDVSGRPTSIVGGGLPIQELL